MNEIKQARQNAKLTQKAMSEQLGIPRRTIEDWDRGINQPPEYVKRLVVAELERIAQSNNNEK